MYLNVTLNGDLLTCTYLMRGDEVDRDEIVWGTEVVREAGEGESNTLLRRER